MLIGQVPLRDLTAQDVRRTLTGWLRRGRPGLWPVHNVLVRAIRHAEANDRVGRNVASLVKPPQGKTGRPSRAMTAAEAVGSLARRHQDREVAPDPGPATERGDGAARAPQVADGGPPGRRAAAARHRPGVHQTARIRELEVQQQAFRIAMNEHRRLIPNKDMA